MSNRDPQTDLGNYLRVEEVAPGVFFLCDQDGPVKSGPDLDSGPFSVRADAQHALDSYNEPLF